MYEYCLKSLGLCPTKSPGPAGPLPPGARTSLLVLGEIPVILDYKMQLTSGCHRTVLLNITSL